MESNRETEKNGERGESSSMSKSKLIFAAVLLASTINPKEVKATENYQDPTPIVQPYRTFGPYRSAEEENPSRFPTYSPLCYSVEVGDNITTQLVEEEREFDSSIMDISSWETNRMELEDIQIKEKGFVVKTVADKTDLYSIPLLQSTFIHRKYNDQRPLKKISLPKSMNFEILQERTLQGENGESITLGLVSNDYKSQQGFVLVMKARDKFGVEKVFVEKEENVGEDVLDTSLDLTYKQLSSGEIQQYPVNGEVSEQIDLLYSLEDFPYLDSFIDDDETVQSFLHLRDEFSEYDVNTNDLPNYLKTTDWYREMLEKNGEEIVKGVINIPYIVRIPSQPLQCVGFVEMMEELYPELNMVDISSFSTEKGAQSLVPSSLYSNYYRESPLKVPLYNGGVGIGGYAIAIDEYKRGDIFVISGGDFGHVGLVLGKYEVNGQKLLLLADSNKLIDGKVRLYVANENNIDKLLGEQRFILRNE